MTDYAKRDDDHIEFLPAALELLDRPPAPSSRILIYFIVFCFAATIAWAIIGKVDVVVSGQGRVIPSGQVKSVQAFENGVIRNIHVVEGQEVTEGDTLVTLDPTDTETSVEILRLQLREAQLDLALSSALLSDTPVLDFVPPDGFGTQKLLETQKQINATYQSYLSRLAELDAETARLTAQATAMDIEIQKLDDVLPVLENRMASSGTLLRRDAVRETDRLTLQQTLIETKAARNTLVQNQAQITASLDAIAAQRTQVDATYRTEQLNQSRTAQARIGDLEQQITAEQQRNAYRIVRAPASGFVEQLAVFTVGGVVGAGEVLMTIVPTQEDIEIEAMILNKDIGFVSPQQAAEVKLEAFPFTRYGVLDGEITKVSTDAIAHDTFGLVYKVTVRLTTSDQALEDAGITVGPGMNATVEVQTDKRRVIDYFISPVLRYKDEAIRER